MTCGFGHGNKQFESEGGKDLLFDLVRSRRFLREPLSGPDRDLTFGFRAHISLTDQVSGVHGTYQHDKQAADDVFPSMSSTRPVFEQTSFQEFVGNLEKGQQNTQKAKKHNKEQPRKHIASTRVPRPCPRSVPLSGTRGPALEAHLRRGALDGRRSRGLLAVRRHPNPRPVLLWGVGFSTGAFQRFPRDKEREGEETRETRGKEARSLKSARLCRTLWVFAF